MPQGSLSRSRLITLIVKTVSRSTHKPKKPGFFLKTVGENQISPEIRFLRDEAIASPPINQRNRVSS
ncbi:MAG: hypothetical protein ACRCT1_14930 [Microcoleaceae cyanobacterium]